MFTAFAENLYVRPDGGSYGTETGTDWNNAFDGFGNVQFGSGAGKAGAGDTLFIAGGKYTSDLEPTVDGSANSPVVIKKATAGVHGTGTGWSAALADQAELYKAYIDLRNHSYITVDGTYKYGIKMQGLDDSGGIVKNIWIGSDVNQAYKSRDLTIKYIHMIGPGQITCDGTVGIGVFGNFRRVDNLTITNVKAHEFSGACFRMGEHDGVLIEDCEIYNVQNASAAACGGNNPHNTHIALYGGTQSDNIVIRNCYLYQEYDNNIVNGGYAVGFGYVSGNVDIYNNVFFNTNNPMLCAENNMPTVPGARINFFANTVVGYRVIAWKGTFYAYNNIFCNKGYDPYYTRYPYSTGAVPDHYNNLFYKDAYSNDYNNGKNFILPDGVDPFEDYSRTDVKTKFLLKEGSMAIGNAKDLGSAYAFDLNGTVRPQGSGWDIGALEYTTTNIEYRTSNAEFRIPHLPALPNPVEQKMINDLRLTINDIRFYTTLGQLVPVNQQLAPGLYLMAIKGIMRELVVIK
jgi:hypothetical protein